MNLNFEGAQQAVALIKFFEKKEHYELFKNGSSLFRTPHYYRTKCENVGRGDRAESCLGYWDLSLGDRMPNLIFDGVPKNIEGVQSLLVYPVHEQQDAWLQSWAMIGPHNNFENSLEQMLKEFGTYFVLLPASKISKYAQLVSTVSSLKVSYGLVEYSDDPLKRSLSVKDSRFSYQKEFRFYLGECSKGELQDKPLNLPCINELLLEASSLRLESPSGAVKYCSLGREKVVTV